MDLTASFQTIALLFFAGWATPGPNHLAIASSATSNGRLAGLATAWGISAAVVVWTVLSLAGAAALFEIFPGLFFAIRLAGAAYLIWLGIGAFRRMRTGGMFSQASSDVPPGRAFATGFLVCITNPKAVLFFGSILTAFIPKDASSGVLLALLIMLVAQSFIQNTFAALVLSSAAVMGAFQRAGFAIALLFGILFCVLGFSVAYEALLEFIGSVP